MTNVGRPPSPVALDLRELLTRDAAEGKLNTERHYRNFVLDQDDSMNFKRASALVKRELSRVLKSRVKL